MIDPIEVRDQLARTLDSIERFEEQDEPVPSGLTKHSERDLRRLERHFGHDRLTALERGDYAERLTRVDAHLFSTAPVPKRAPVVLKSRPRIRRNARHAH